MTPPTSIPSTFTFAEGTSAYDLQQITTVTVGADGTMPAEDTLRTTAGLTLAIVEGGGVPTAMVTIDSLVISSVRDTMAPVRQLGAPVIVQFPVGTVIQQSVDSTTLLSTCDSMEDAARVLASDVHLPIPVIVERGRTWNDSTESIVCRGGIPLTVSRVSSFQITDVRSTKDSTLVLVERQTTLSLAGSGMQGSRRVSVRGEGTSQTLFNYDLRAGRFLGSNGRSELLLGFETIQQTEQVVQRSISSVRLRSLPGGDR